MKKYNKSIILLYAITLLPILICSASEEKQTSYWTLYINQQDSVGNTHLHDAVLKNKSIEHINMLIKTAGADVNATNHEKKTPLHIAMESVYTSPELVTLLIRSGANTRLRDGDKLRPIQIAYNDERLYTYASAVLERHLKPWMTKKVTNYRSRDEA